MIYIPTPQNCQKWVFVISETRANEKSKKSSFDMSNAMPESRHGTKKKAKNIHRKHQPEYCSDLREKAVLCFLP